MLGLLLGWMAYDTVTTVNRRIDRKQKAQKRDFRIYEIERKLRKGLNRNHYIDCSCKKCKVKKLSLETELKSLITQKTQESK